MYSVDTDALLRELPATTFNEAEVRRAWGVPDGDSYRPLRVTRVQLEFVNQHLAEALELRDSEEAYVEQYAD